MMVRGHFLNLQKSIVSCVIIYIVIWRMQEYVYLCNSNQIISNKTVTPGPNICKSDLGYNSFDCIVRGVKNGDLFIFQLVHLSFFFYLSIYLRKHCLALNKKVTFHL